MFAAEPTPLGETWPLVACGLLAISVIAFAAASAWIAWGNRKAHAGRSSGVVAKTSLKIGCVANSLLLAAFALLAQHHFHFMPRDRFIPFLLALFSLLAACVVGIVGVVPSVFVLSQGASPRRTAIAALTINLIPLVVLGILIVFLGATGLAP